MVVLPVWGRGYVARDARNLKLLLGSPMLSDHLFFIHTPCLPHQQTHCVLGLVNNDL